jgi:hypothetical protein
MSSSRKRNYHAEWLKTKSRLDVRRNFLIISLGGKCRLCRSTENIELDHPNGKDWEARKLSPQMRMKRYEEDNERGQLDLLCKSCKCRDGALNKDFYSAVRRNKAPF